MKQKALLAFFKKEILFQDFLAKKYDPLKDFIPYFYEFTELQQQLTRDIVSILDGSAQENSYACIHLMNFDWDNYRRYISQLDSKTVSTINVGKKQVESQEKAKADADDSEESMKLYIKLDSGAVLKLSIAQYYHNYNEQWLDGTANLLKLPQNIDINFWELDNIDDAAKSSDELRGAYAGRLFNDHRVTSRATSSLSSPPDVSKHKPTSSSDKASLNPLPKKRKTADEHPSEDRKETRRLKNREYASRSRKRQQQELTATQDELDFLVDTYEATEREIGLFRAKNKKLQDRLERTLAVAEQQYPGISDVFSSDYAP